jgi:hypothetical protein
MRLTKAATTGLVVVAVVAIAGTGFAAFTTSAFITANGGAGNLGPLVWGTTPAYGGFASNDICTATTGTTSSPGDTLVLTAGNLLPGDTCAYGDVLNNLGSLPAGATEEITTASGSLCSSLVYEDNFFSPSVPVSVGQTSTVPHTIPAAGGPGLQWEGFIQLSASAGNVGGENCHFIVTVSATTF